MKLLIEKLKHNTLFGFVAGIIFCSGIVYGINLYNSEEISYEPSDASWEVSNVGDAINSLYEMQQEINAIKTLGNATAANISNGKTAVVQGKLITGTGINVSSIPVTYKLSVYQNTQQWITVDCYLYYNNKQILRINGWQMANSSNYGDPEKTQTKNGSATISIS